MVSVILVAAILFACAMQVQCGDVPEQTCATLFSGENFGGESFSLTDFDQSANFKREYRHTSKGWADTKSIKVENGCALTTCSGTYFRGSCKTFFSPKPSLSQLMPTVKSVNCSCERSCRCEDFYITDNEKDSFGYVGRAYMKGGCDTCNSEYITLYTEGNAYIQHMYSDVYKDAVEALVLYNGCSITFFTEREFRGNKLPVIEGPVYRGQLKSIQSYKITCQPSTPKDWSSKFQAYLPLGDLPTNSKALQEMLLSNKTLANHPGVRAALDSAKINRSSRHVYVIIISDYAPNKYGFAKCARQVYDAISECRIPVGVDDLGITSELRIISVPSPKHSSDLVKDLDAYLSTHEELNRNIPNAVIVASFIHFKDIFDENSDFQKTLKAVKEFRHRLIDDNYSNLIFQLGSLHALSPTKQQRQPETKLAEFEKVIRDKLDFLNPVAFSISSGTQKGVLYHVNGYGQMENGEFWPRNLEIGLINICEKSRDPLGKSILRAHFKENLPPRSNTRIISEGTGREDYIEWSTIDDDYECECESVRAELEDEIDRLKSELQDERNERLNDGARIAAELWEEFKLKWKMYFEL